MNTKTRSIANTRSWFVPGLLTACAVGLLSQSTQAQDYVQHNLVSSQPGVAAQADPDLLNPWGLLVFPGGQILVADNHSNLATIYKGDGGRLPFALSVDEAPTGLVLNSSPRDFLVGMRRHRRGSLLLFCTEAGRILGWNPALNSAAAGVVVDNSPAGAVYKGMTLGAVRGRSFLYAADFHNGRVDMYDRNFNWIRSFTDATVDPGFAPFNVLNIHDRLFVTFARQFPPDNEDDLPGPGNGFVDVFDLQGNLLRRFASHGVLDSPWGMALAPREFGRFGGALLIGNFGDGLINAFDPASGQPLGSLTDPMGAPIQIEGLWSLTFGGHHDGDRDDNDRAREDWKHHRHEKAGGRLYFTAGPNGEEDGLLGWISPR